jgi:aspartyl-tRNA(Asn)/glutamyl-tRNA(Gln) amidotransferase subunit A
MTTELHFLTVAEASELIRARKLSPVEYADALLERTSALDSQLNAFITLTADIARKQARDAETEITAGRYRGPLHGIPVGLKDIYNTRGILTSGGSKVAMSNVPGENATTTRMLEEAGMVLAGKLQLHEFAHGGPSFDLPWPPSRNPWNLEHVTGGSSSGSGAALAAGLIPASLGSDTGGSVRNPATFCGIVGLKPTSGLVSRAGVIPNSYTLDHCGPMARTVEDCAILLQAIAGYDRRDPGSVRAEIPDYRGALRRDIKGLRIGVLRHYWEEDMPAHPDLCSAMEEAIGVFEALGAKVEDCRTHPLQDSFGTKIIIGESEIYSVHYQDLITRPGDFGRDFLGRILPACLFDAADYVQASREHYRIIAETGPLYDKYDVFLTAGLGPAPRLDAHRTMSFWQKRTDMFRPANLTGAPALVLPCGFSNGLPMGMQLIGRPFDDAGVLRAGHAYQQATDWHTRHPRVVAGAPQPAVRLTGNEPNAAPDLNATTRAFVLDSAHRAGLRLNDYQATILLEGAPYALEMAQRMRKSRDRMEPPALSFHLPH